MINTVIAITLIIVLGLTALVAGSAGTFLYVYRKISSESRPQAGYEERIVALELQVQGLPSLWEEERARAKRLKDSAEAARRSADKKLEEIEEHEQSQLDLPAFDGAGIEEPEMFPMRRNMGVPTEAGIQERAAAVAHLLG